MRAVAFRFRAEWRAGWRAWVVLAVLVGAVAGTALVLVAGSRRTGSAHERFLAEQHAMDVVVSVECANDRGCADRVGRLPAVEYSTTVSNFPAYAETVDGRSLQFADDTCYSGPGQVVTVYDPSGRWGTTINRHRFVAGRPANPRAADEVVLSVETARRMHLAVGSVVNLWRFDGGDCLAARSSWQPARPVRIVGIHLSPGEVRPPSGMYLQTIELTPAFVRRYGDTRDREVLAVVRLRPGATIGALQQQARDAGFEAVAALTRSDISGLVGRAIRPNEVSLLILGALTALAGAVVLGQVLVRQAAAETGDDDVLAALGMPTSGRVALAALRGGTLGMLAAAAAAAVALGASPIMPIGLARTVEPARGLSIDLAVIGVGALATMLFVAAMSFVASVLVTTRRERGPRSKPARLANAARARRLLSGRGDRRALRARARERCGGRAGREQLRGADDRGRGGSRRAHLRRRPLPPARHAATHRMELGPRARVSGGRRSRCPVASGSPAPRRGGAGLPRRRRRGDGNHLVGIPERARPATRSGSS